MFGKDIKPNLSICAGGFRYREKKKEGKIGCVERASSDEKQFRVLTNEYRRGAFGGNRGTRPVPPEKGVFPLDHMHLCDMDKKEYISCLKSEGHKSEKCRQFSKKYLECRMEKNLMAKQDMSELGFREDMALQASANVYD